MWDRKTVNKKCYDPSIRVENDPAAVREPIGEAIRTGVIGQSGLAGTIGVLFIVPVVSA